MLFPRELVQSWRRDSPKNGIRQNRYLKQCAGRPDEFLKKSPKMWPNLFKLEIDINHCYRGNRGTKIRATFCIYIKVPKAKSRPICRRKIAKSGHPGQCVMWTKQEWLVWDKVFSVQK
jgi:hypothetical protein